MPDITSEDDSIACRVQGDGGGDWSAFTYLGASFRSDSTRRREESTPKMLNSEANKQLIGETSQISLARTSVGDRVRIVSLNCDDANNRLMGMGLIPGAVLQVISCMPTGSVVVALQDRRLGIGGEMAQRIQVAATVLSSNSESSNSDSATAASAETAAIAAETTDKAVPASVLKLQEAALGSTLKVTGYAPTARPYKRKLLAMGLTPGTELTVVRHAPLGDPTEIDVRGFRLSLRKDEAAALIVELV